MNYQRYFIFNWFIMQKVYLTFLEKIFQDMEPGDFSFCYIEILN